MASDEAKSVEFVGKSVEEATDKGLSELNLTREQVLIEVIDPGRSGLLGLGAQEARVRLTDLSISSPRRDDEPTYTAPVDITSEPASAGEDEQEIEPTPLEAATGEMSDLAKLGVDILQGLIDRMGVQGEVVTDTGEDLVEEGEDPPLILNITGRDLGILIGRQGETLQALQYLTRLMISKKQTRWEPVVVDVESYRARRRRSLRQLANRMAERVASSNRRVVLETMPPNERRIVHLTLQNHPDVMTKSIGEGDNRKVTIIPK